MSGHTPGRLMVHIDGVDGWPLLMIGGPAGRIVANVNAESGVDTTKAPSIAFKTMPAAENARRLAACWNAAEGLPTAELEAAADGRLLNVFEALVRDRDALLAGVREANLALRDMIAKNPTMAGTQRGSTTLGNLAAELGALIQKAGTP